MPCKRKEPERQCTVCLIDKDQAARQLMQPPQGRRLWEDKVSKQCDRSRHNDRRAPERSKIACLDILKIRSECSSATTSSGVSPGSTSAFR